jgi:hypothetical protein
MTDGMMESRHNKNNDLIKIKNKKERADVSSTNVGSRVAVGSSGWTSAVHSIKRTAEGSLQFGSGCRFVLEAGQGVSPYRGLLAAHLAVSTSIGTGFPGVGVVWANQGGKQFG